MGATQALIRLERWSEHWCLFNPNKCEASFFSVDSHQANLQPHLFLFNSPFRFIPIPTFLGLTFNHTLSFFKHVSLLKVKFFPRLKALRRISAPSWDPPKSPSLFYTKLFFGSFSFMLHPFFPLSLALPTLLSYNSSSSAQARPFVLSYFSSLL